MDKDSSTSASNPLLEQTITLRFAGAPLVVGEMTFRQTLQLSDMQDELVDIDLSNLVAITKQHQPTVVKVLTIVLGVDRERVLSAKASELEAALQACVALNKSFFLRMMQLWVGAVGVKSQIQRQLVAAQTMQTMQAMPVTPPPAASGSTPLGQPASAPSSPQGTTSSVSTPTATANTLPISPLSTTAGAAG
jgi:hypothetical protein